MKPRAPILLLLAILVVGCSAAPTSSPAEADETASVAASASRQPSEERSPPASAPGACDPGAVCDGPVAGEVTSTSTGATVTLTVPDGPWIGQRDIPGVGFALFREDLGSYAGISVTSFDGQVFAEACDPNAGLTEIEDTPDAFVGWLSEREGITAAEPVETTIGERRAVYVDVTSQLPEGCTEPPWIFLWALPEVGDFHLNDGENARFYAVEAADSTVIIAVEAFPDVEWETFLPDAEEVIGTMEFDAGT